jgi:hypothetical protein
MDPLNQAVQNTRREFLTTAASGLGGIALSSLLNGPDAAAATPSTTPGTANPLAARQPHFPARAKNCIFIFMAGAPSHLDLFDYRPTLQKLDGKPMPESLLKDMRFAFIQKESAVLLGSKRKFTQHGQNGMWFSDLLPHIATCADDICMIKSMHTDQFNHHPGQLLMQTGEPKFGLPTMGAWLSYGLGTENQNLPSYAVLTAGRGSSGGATLWQSGYLPSIYAGVRLRSEGEPILNLSNPKGMPMELQRKGLDALARLNRERFDRVQDPEIASRIANYELAFRMQTAAPELVDLSDESDATLDSYGVRREDAKVSNARGGGPGQFAKYARNCLLARRMVERGVRFINIIHASWDHHSGLDAGLGFNTGMADQPIAALIKDLKQRGMLDDTLVVWAGEFGRTPLGENRNGSSKITGRDHHPKAFCTWMAGGGTKGGLTYGETDEVGWGVVENPVSVNDFQATILHLFGMDHNRLTYPYQGAPMRLTSVARGNANVVTKILA